MVEFQAKLAEARAELAVAQSEIAADRCQALAVEAQARRDALAMRRAYLCSNLDAVACRGPEHTRVDQENRKLEEAIAARDEAAVATARERARYHAALHAVEEAMEAAAKRAHCDSSMAEVVEHRRPQDEE
jgi:hypothetical protein